jgi:hypothetical protein
MYFCGFAKVIEVPSNRKNTLELGPKSRKDFTSQYKKKSMANKKHAIYLANIISDNYKLDIFKDIKTALHEHLADAFMQSICLQS